MELPRPLAPWAEYLDLFPRDLALPLGPLVQRVDRIIGALSSGSRSDKGDPDGFDGIARRGTYERLLLSEWLLAEEVPDEFLRRSVMGEHVFLQLARREPAGTKTSVALFDGGPGQWGAPRIAQMAALIVLARRANATGARFLWGILQTPEGTLFSEPFTEVSAATIGHFLQSRTPRDSESADLDAWRRRLDAESEDDLWLIGGKEITGWPNLYGASHLQVDDVYEPDARCVEIQIPAGARKRTPVRLELPEDAVCARLLRDPFGAATRVPPSVKSTSRGFPASNLVFATGGSKLLARSQRKGVLSYAIPNSPHAPSGKPKRFQSVYGNTIIAAGRIAKSTVIVSIPDTLPVFRVEVLGTRSEGIVEGTYPWELGDGFDPHLLKPDDPMALCFALPSHFSRPPSEPVHIWFQTATGYLFCLSVTDGKPMAKAMDQRVGSVTPLREDRLAYASWPDRRRELTSIDRHGHRKQIACSGSGSGFAFGFSGPLADEWFGLFAVEGEANEWHVNPLGGSLVTGGHAKLIAPRGMSVHGVVVITSAEGTSLPALVLLSGDRRIITLLGQGITRPLPRTASPITHVTVSTFSPQIAYVTERGDVFVYSIPHNAFLYQMAGAGGDE